MFEIYSLCICWSLEAAVLFFSSFSESTSRFTGDPPRPCSDRLPRAEAARPISLFGRWTATRPLTSTDCSTGRSSPTTRYNKVSLGGLISLNLRLSQDLNSQVLCFPPEVFLSMHNIGQRCSGGILGTVELSNVCLKTTFSAKSRERNKPENLAGGGNLCPGHIFVNVSPEFSAAARFCQKAGAAAPGC